jgi:tetratricopeptide (TPR) repeat protein
MKSYACLLALLVLFSVPAFAESAQQSEELTSKQLGTVNFPVSCSAQAQKTLERGVAMLHSFWYEESIKAFQQAAKEDPSCAMAHWGIAMSLWHQLWNRPDQATIKQGLAEAEEAEALHAKTQREREYIAAIKAFYSDSSKLDHEARATAYSQAMEKVYLDYPKDREAAAFYALSLLASEPEDDRNYINRKKAAAILEKLFAEEPDHPGAAHYLIHTYDLPSMARLGLPAAERYAKIAPAAPHALHMPSHIFARLGMWQEDIASNLASIAASRRDIALHMGGGSHQFHAMAFLFYAYLQCGEEAKAKQLIVELKAMPPTQNMYGMNFDPRLADLTEFEAFYPLELHHWAEAAALTPEPGAEPGDEAMIYWARAIGKAHTGDVAGAKKDLAEIASLKQDLLAEKRKGPAEAVDGNLRQAQAWIYHAEGKNDLAISTLAALAKEEEGDREPDQGLAAREMLGDLQLELKRPQEALEDYELDLKLNPNRFDALYGAAQAAEMAGKSAQADTYYAQLVKTCAGSDSDRPELSRAKALLAKK